MMSSCLLLRLKSPLQSWGADSHFPLRRTHPVPTKSGVIGLLASALGRVRGEKIDDLSALEFAVRTENPGVLIEDFHTARTLKGASMPLSRRFYLSDAHFTAALGGNRDFLEEIAQALENPRWPLFLGRRSCPPSGKVSLGVHEGSPREILKTRKPEMSFLSDQHLRQEEHLYLDIFADSLKDSGLKEYLRDFPVDYSAERRRFAERKIEHLKTDPLINPHYRSLRSQRIPVEDHDPLDLALEHAAHPNND